jgi:hypothetical protein
MQLNYCTVFGLIVAKLKNKSGEWYSTKNRNENKNANNNIQTEIGSCNCLDFPNILFDISGISVTGGPLPAGITPAVTMEGGIWLSFTPNPIGVGQTLLVNLWSIPAPGANRAHTGYTVTFTKPDGTKDVVGPLNSYVADGTAWFEYVPDQIGNWTIQFTYPGDYYPAGRYVNGVLNNSAPAGSSFMDQRDYPETWYKPPKHQYKPLQFKENQ